MQKRLLKAVFKEKLETCMRRLLKNAKGEGALPQASIKAWIGEALVVSKEAAFKASYNSPEQKSSISLLKRLVFK